MKIIRAPRPTHDFTLLPNVLLRDSRLSYRARGVLVALLSHADGWQSNAESLAAVGKEGRGAVRTALDELEACGYLTRDRIQDADAGTWSTVWTVHETPKTGFRSSVAPMTGFQSSDNRTSVSRSSIEDHQEESPLPPSTDRLDEPCDQVNQPHANCRHCGTTRRVASKQEQEREAADRRDRESQCNRAAIGAAKAAAKDAKHPVAQRALGDARAAIRRAAESS